MANPLRNQFTPGKRPPITGTPVTQESAFAKMGKGPGPGPAMPPRRPPITGAPVTQNGALGGQPKTGQGPGPNPKLNALKKKIG